MNQPDLGRGDFTLPGEAGHEQLTLRLAEKWGADTIRDSDGTRLSPEILKSGYAICSTLCLVRSVQPWARGHRDHLQQNFLMSFPVVAAKATTVVALLAGYYPEQFAVNWRGDARRWWQVFDRTTGREVPRSRWSANPRQGTVTIRGTEAGHRYTVNFLALRQWEEISMYNHLTNAWGDREHLAAVDPMQPAVQRELLAFLERWLDEHPDTRVVRFTSMFYNFSWFWGADHARLRDVYSDWGDYAMTVSPRALREFARARGYRLTSEDFVNGGLYNSTHNVPSRRYRDYQAFIHDFVIRFGRQCVERVHRRGKLAYVFYDDHWIGVEPNSPRFAEFGFDGLIKCVFDAFEVRLCAHARGVRVHELRLHPYLFPTGLKGEPTFQAGGHPARDAARFWNAARRGVIRAPIDRIGLGGYLSLAEAFPDFQETVARIAREFRLLKSLHAAGPPWASPLRVAVLTAWGGQRAWTCSGHRVPGVALVAVLESLAGLPLDVRFLSIDEIAAGGVPRGVRVMINAGRAGTAWSGGSCWDDPRAEAALTRWIRGGGGFVGIAEPSARAQPGQRFRLAAALGLDRDGGERLANGKYAFARPAAPVAPHFITADVPAGAALDLGRETDGIFVLGPDTEVLAERDGSPRLAVHAFGRGRAVYLAGFESTPIGTRLLHRALFWAGSAEAGWPAWHSANPRTEASWFPAAGRLVVLNNAETDEATEVTLGDGRTTQAVRLDACSLAVLDV